jgi:hypothetical protein
MVHLKPGDIVKGKKVARSHRNGKIISISGCNRGRKFRIEWIDGSSGSYSRSSIELLEGEAQEIGPVAAIGAQPAPPPVLIPPVVPMTVMEFNLVEEGEGSDENDGSESSRCVF